ncbi:MAG TPA: hypothetical protein VGP31_08460 [Planosporangium sp.]|jgi:hypothetical protein|nr:hypothetical protein [Planosporangium sp.]
MPNRIHAAVPRRWGRHILIRLAVVVAAGMLFVFVMAQSWSVTSKGLSDVEAERHGVAYLQPLVQLIGELTDAQSAAVHGAQPNATQIDAAVTAVDGADDTHGDPLGTHRRWSELRGRIATLMGQRVGGDQAYAAYSAVVALAVDLVHKIGDASRLVPDPQLDTYYLADATLMRVPDVLVGAGRAADLAVLAERNPADGAQTRVSVARYQVSVASEELSTSLHKALDHRTVDGAAAAMGPNLAGQLDAFTSAVDAFVPPAMWLQSLSKVDIATLTSGAERVRQQTRPLAGAALGELDSLLRERQDRLSIRQTWTMLGAGVGLLLLGALLSLLLPARPGLAPAEAGTDEREGTARGMAMSRTGQAGFREAGLGETGLGETGLADPRDPDAADELLRVGRAVRAHRRERVGDVR